MKHLKMLLAAMLLTLALPSFADTTDSDAKAFQSSIISYLTDEGYAPEIDEDGDLKFKYQDETYFITTSAYDDGYYVTFLSLSDLEGLDAGMVLKALDMTMKSLKFVRCYTVDSYNFSVIEVCLYCENLSDFTQMFSNVMEIIITADERLIEHMVDLLK